MYAVSKYTDVIKFISDENLEKEKKKGIFFTEFYTTHATYEEAKAYLIKRTMNRIIVLEDEIKKLRRKLPKLEALKEK